MPPVRETADVTDQAFHGCTKPAADQIVQEGFRLPGFNSENRYGNAVYFWMGSKEQAAWWAKRRCAKGTIVTILGSQVAYGLHLNVATWEAQKLMKKVASEIAQRQKTTEVTEAAVLNFLASKGWIETALVVDIPQTAATKLFTSSHSLEGTRLILCVYRLEKILNSRIVLEEAA